MLRYVAILFIISGIILAFWFLFFGNFLNGDFRNPNASKARDLQPFFTGIVAPLLTLGTTFLLFENLRNTSRQNFSNNFFKLIDQHHKLVDSISSAVLNITTEDAPSKGRAFFDDLCWRIANDYQFLPVDKTTSDYDLSPNKDIAVQKLVGKAKLLVIYDYYFHLAQSDLGHYFRNLYNIIRYTERSPFSGKFKKQHIKMLRAQLSNYEILLLAYNGLHDYGLKFHRLIEKFELLKNLNTEERVHPNWNKRIIDIDILRENYAHLQRHHKSRAKT